MGDIYITGDKHGDFSRLCRTICQLGTDRESIMIILGDSGINYYVKNLPEGEIREGGPRFKIQGQQ